MIRSPSALPWIETLHERFCPSAVAFHGGTLLIQGDNSAEAVAIADDGRGNVSATVDGQTTSGTGIHNVVINLRGGNDTLTYTASGELTSRLHLNLHLGRGDDQATLDFGTGTSASRLKIDLHADDGADRVTATFGDVTDTHLFLNGHLGKGHDTFDATLAGDLLGAASVRFLVLGDKDDDALGVHATGTDIDPGVKLALDLSGGQDADGVTVDYQGVLKGSLRLGADGGQRGDTLTANLTVDTGSTGSLDAAEMGQQDDDALTLNVTDDTDTGGGTTLSALHAVADGGQGTNSVTTTPNVEVRNG